MIRRGEGSFLVLLSAALAFCSMSYEILIAHAISMLVEHVILIQSLTIGVYVGSLGAGAFLFTRLGKSPSLFTLFRIEIALSLISAISLFGVFLVFMTARSFFLPSLPFLENSNQVYVVIAVAQLFTVAIGLLSGFELPVLLGLREELREPPRENIVLFANYFGALGGALVVPVILLPVFDVFWAVLAVSFFNLSLAAIVFLAAKPAWPAWKGRVRGAVVFVVSLGVLIVMTSCARPFYEHYLKMHYSRVTANELSWRSLRDVFRLSGFYGKVERIPSRYQYIDLLDYRFYQGIDRSALPDSSLQLYLNLNIQFHSGRERYYHQQMIHAPIAMAARVPKKVLVLGGGDGLLVRELLRYGDEIDEIELVELDPVVIDLAMNDPRFLLLNHGSLMNSKVNLRVGDAFAHLRQSDRKYDAIWIDFPFPTDYELSKLYSREFYAFVKRRLDSGGYAVFDYPLLLPEFLAKVKGPMRHTNDVIASTLFRAGISDAMAFGYSEHFVVFGLGSAELPSQRPRFMDSEIFEKLRIHREVFEEAQVADRFVNSVFRPVISGQRTTLSH